MISFLDFLAEAEEINLGLKLLKGLSHNSRSALESWEWANWTKGDLEKAFKQKSGPIYDEIVTAGEPIRTFLRKRYGSHVTLYRGIGNDPDHKPDMTRALFSWTSDERVAGHFAGHLTYKGKGKYVPNAREPFSKAEIDKAVATYERTGFVKFDGKKYIRNKQAPQYYNIFDRSNQFVTDGDDLRRDFESNRDDELEWQKRVADRGRVVTKRIPVEDIVWVLNGGNAKEFIVKGHHE